MYVLKKNPLDIKDCCKMGMCRAALVVPLLALVHILIRPPLICKEIHNIHISFELY